MSGLTKEDVLQIIKDNVSIRVKEDKGYYGDTSVIVNLMVGDEVVSSDSYYIGPSKSHF